MIEFSAFGPLWMYETMWLEKAQNDWDSIQVVSYFPIALCTVEVEARESMGMGIDTWKLKQHKNDWSMDTVEVEATCCQVSIMLILSVRTRNYVTLSPGNYLLLNKLPNKLCLETFKICQLFNLSS